MNRHDETADRRFDDLLRSLGPEVPLIELDDAARARLRGVLEAPLDASLEAPSDRASQRRTTRRIFTRARIASAIAAILAVACAALFIRGERARSALAESRSQTQEALDLFITARRTQPIIPVPEDLTGIRSSDLLLIAFHHDLCPLSRACTPRFREMEAEHGGDSTRFRMFDVTGEKRASVAEELEAMGVDFALLGAPGSETGVVKVLDMSRRRLLSSAPGSRGVEQARALLDRVANAEG